MSEHGSAESAASSARSGDKPKRAATLTDLVKKLHQKLGHADTLSLTDHLKAANVLCSIRNRLANGETMDGKTLILLLCSGIACYRRWSVGESGETTAGASAKNEADELKMNEEAKELVHSTATRIFVLLCTAERQKGRRGDDAVAASREAVAVAGLSSTWAQIAPPPPKKKKAKRADGAAAQEEEEPEDDRREEPSWSVATHLTAGEVARHALVLCVNCLEDEAYTAIDGIMGLFYRNASANMGANMLMPSGNQDFVSLAMAKPMAELKGDERTKRLAALSIAAESEAGQSIVRDLLLSFLLPASHAGVRRTLLLTRACSTRAGVDYPELTSRSHEVAMAGAEWIWAQGTDELERLCCIMAGLAVLTTKGGEDPIRKQDAFCGRLQLPFLETKPPPPEAMRITLIPHAKRWVLYRLDQRGMPKILCSLRGFDGFCDAALQLVASMR